MKLYSHPGETIQSVAAAAWDPGRITDLGGNSTIITGKSQLRGPVTCSFSD